MKKKIAGIFLCILLIGAYTCGAMNIGGNKNYEVITNEFKPFSRQTETFYSKKSDGHILFSHANYNTVWTSETGYVYAGNTDIGLGQSRPETVTFVIERTYLLFDTSDIPNDATITSASLSLYGSVDQSDVDFNIVIQNGQPTYPHDPLISSDYNKEHYSGNGGSLNTSEWTNSGYNDISIDTEDLNWINKQGTTKLCLRNDREIAGIPTPKYTRERIAFFSSEKGGNYRPKLIVEYTIPDNDPPSSPLIIGPVIGGEGKDYEFKFMSTDPERDDLYYYVDWGDGTNTGWKGPYTQGVWKEFNHKWDDPGVFEIKAKAKDSKGAESDWSNYGIAILPLPDLKPVMIYTKPDIFWPADEVCIIAIFGNFGSIDIDQPFNVKLNFDGETIKTERFNGLPKGQTHDIEHKIEWPNDYEWYLISVSLDIDREIEEIDEDNNYMNKYDIASLPDLVVTDIKTDPYFIWPGQDNVKIIAYVENRGERNPQELVDNWHLRISIEGHGFIFEYKVFKEFNHEPGTIKSYKWTLPVNWPFNFKKYTICAIADTYDEVREIDENNNEKCIEKRAPRNKAISNSLLLLFLERFPLLEILLHNIRRFIE